MKRRLRYFLFAIVFFLYSLTTNPVYAKWHPPLVHEQMDKTHAKGTEAWKREISLWDGDSYTFSHYVFTQNSDSLQQHEIYIRGEQGVFRYVENLNGKRTWKTIPLKGTLPKAMGFVETNCEHLLVGKPALYKKGANHTLAELTASPYHVKKTKDGYTLSTSFPRRKGTHGDAWFLRSAFPLIDWNNKVIAEVWASLDLHEKKKWAWDGYYIETPSNYTPHGPNVYWRIPLNYVARSFIMTGGNRAAYNLGWIMLHTTLPHQNEQGFWPSEPRSGWLWKDYGIDAGFFDTRFNTDQALTYLYAGQLYNDPAFLEANERYSNYLLQHIDRNHYVVPGWKKGIMVADYAHPRKHLKTLSSLNHHLCEINYLYEMYLFTKKKKYRKYADRMLQGVKNLGERWVKPDGSLHYAYLPNDQIGMPDYPYLTYNDLVETQRLLQKVYGKKDKRLQRIMDLKRQSMDKYGITQYRKK